MIVESYRELLHTAPAPAAPAFERLSDLLARHAVPPCQLVDYAVDVAEALSLMHDQGVSHGAVTAGNILVANGRARLGPTGLLHTGSATEDILDFGDVLRSMLAESELQAIGGGSARLVHAALARIERGFVPHEGGRCVPPMRKVLLALKLLRMSAVYAGHPARLAPCTAPSALSLPAPPSQLVSAPNESAAPAPAPPPHGTRRKVLMLVRAVPDPGTSTIAAAKDSSDTRPLWLMLASALILVATYIGLFLYLKR